MIASMFLLSFTATKFLILCNKQNPLLSNAVFPGYYDSSYKFNFLENDFKIAVSVLDYQTREPKMDPDYVRWVA